MPPVTLEISSEVFFFSLDFASLCAATIRSSRISLDSFNNVSSKEPVLYTGLRDLDRFAVVRFHTCSSHTTENE